MRVPERSAEEEARTDKFLKDLNFRWFLCRLERKNRSEEEDEDRNARVCGENEVAGGASIAGVSAPSSQSVFL